MIAKRPLLLCLSLFIAGIAVTALTGSCLYISIALFAVLLKPLRNKGVCILYVIMMLMGSVHIISVTDGYDNFSVKYDGKYCSVYGEIIQVKKDGYETKSVTVKADYIKRTDSFAKENARIIVYTDDRNVRKGDYVTASGIISIPREPVDDFAFDYKTYLRSEGISGVMYASESEIAVSRSNKRYVMSLAERAGMYFKKHMGKENAAFMTALVTGDRDSFTEKMKDDFAASGIYHVVAVSGMHVTILVVFITQLLKRLFKSRRTRNTCGVLCILMYLIAIGFTPSAVRAGIIGILMLAAQLFSRRADFYTSTAISAAVILYVNPYSIYATGFLLSYLAVLGICAFSPYLEEHLPLEEPVKQIVSMSVSAEIATLPVRIWCFNTVSLYGLIANIAVVPLVETMYVLGLLGTIFPPMLYITGPILNLMSEASLSAVSAIASLPHSSFAVGKPTALVIMLISVCIIMLWAAVKNKRKLASATLVGICILLIAVPQFGRGTTVNYVNVGQGDSSVIRTKSGKVYIIDTGMDNEAAQSWLRANAVRKADILFISHIDDDHSGGAEDIIKSLSVKTLVLPYVKEYNRKTHELEYLARSVGTDVVYAHKNQSFKTDECEFKILSPEKDTLKFGDTNENSLVIKLCINGADFLFMGDAGFLSEELLAGEDLKCDVLKVAHHGSKYSTSEEFLDNAQAGYAVLSYGENSFGHPSPEVVKKLEERNTVIYRTYTDGSITFEISKDGKVSAVEKAGR